MNASMVARLRTMSSALQPMAAPAPALSGREDIFTIYTTSFGSETHLREVQPATQHVLARIIRHPAPAGPTA